MIKKPKAPRKPKNLCVNGFIVAQIDTQDNIWMAQRYIYAQEAKHLSAWLLQFMSWAEYKQGRGNK
jgi:hypothetical protein